MPSASVDVNFRGKAAHCGRASDDGFSPIKLLVLAAVCRLLNLGVGHAAPRVHRTARRHGACVAACGTSAAAGNADGRGYWRRFGQYLRASCDRVPQRPQRTRLCRRPKRDSRVPLAGGPLRSSASAHGRSGPPTCGRNRHARQQCRRAGGQSCDCDDPDRLWCRLRPGSARSCRQPRPARRQCDRDQYVQPGGDGQAATAPS